MHGGASLESRNGSEEFAVVGAHRRLPPFSRAMPIERKPGDAHAPRVGLSSTHVLILIAVAAVLSTLTLTRLQLFAVYENERDAVALLERLGRKLDLHELSTRPTAVDLRDAVTEAGLRVGNPADAVWLDEGRLLRRRGYLFDLGVDDAGRACVRAWPWRAGATGVAVYAYSATAGLLGHANGWSDANGLVRADAQRPMWSGPEARPAVAARGGASVWFDLDDSRSLALASRMP